MFLWLLTKKYFTFYVLEQDQSKVDFVIACVIGIW